jgi:LacI family transcriptional regulator, repressor for deo operon, udp, cdd, tsx, nupC, and nupG
MNLRNTGKITIKDIAKTAEVSTATVSRVINSPESVSDKLRAKVEKIIKDYNFVPNQLAKNFYSNDSQSIAIFVYDISNPFFIKLLEGFNRIAFNDNYTFIICDTENSEEKELKYINYLDSIKVSGLIITEGTSKHFASQVNTSIPCVSVDRPMEGKCACPLITSSNLKGAQKAVDYLIKLNHKKIAFAGASDEISTSNYRKEGYLKALQKNNFPVVEEYIYKGDFSVKSGVKALEYFISLPDTPTAIFCANDLIAQGIILRAHSLNLNIPRDFSVIGFDGVAVDTFYPRITTIGQNIDEIVNKTMEQLFNKIKNKNTNLEKEESPTILISTKLIVGETCRRI